MINKLHFRQMFIQTWKKNLLCAIFSYILFIYIPLQTSSHHHRTVHCLRRILTIQLCHLYNRRKTTNRSLIVTVPLRPSQMSNILSKLDINDIFFKDLETATYFFKPLIGHGWENIRFLSHKLGSIPILTIED